MQGTSDVVVQSLSTRYQGKSKELIVFSTRYIDSKQRLTPVSLEECQISNAVFRFNAYSLAEEIVQSPFYLLCFLPSVAQLDVACSDDSSKLISFASL